MKEKYRRNRVHNIRGPNFQGIKLDGMTLEEIGDKFNLTGYRVRQIKNKALERLRHKSRSESLKNYIS